MTKISEVHITDDTPDYDQEILEISLLIRHR